MAGLIKVGKLLSGGGGAITVAPPDVEQDTGNQTTTAATSDTATFGNATVSGRGVIVCFALKGGRRVSTLTDNKGNTYVQVGYAVDESDAVVEMWYAQSITGGASHTLTVTYDAAANCVWGAIEVSRIKGGGGFLDAQAVRTNVRNNVGSSASVAVTSGTPRATNELFVAMLSLAGGGADAGIDTPTSWTAITQFNNFDGVHAGNGAYRVNGNATALTATWTNDTTDAPAAMIIAPFRAQNAISAGVAAPVNSVLPVITGTPTEGQTLTASTGTWSNSPDSYTYQWKDDGVAISGATASTYVLTAGEVGATITVTVTAHNEGSGSSGVSATSAGVGPVVSSFGMAFVKNSTDQTGEDFSPAKAWTWNTDVTDTSGFHDTGSNTSRLTVPAGVSWVRLSAGIHFQALNANSRVYAYFIKNGTLTIPGFPTQAEQASSVDNYINLQSAAISVSPGDYFEIHILCGDDVSLTIQASSWFAIETLTTTARRALVYKSANEAAVNFQTAAAVTFNTEAYDTSSWHDTGSNTSRLTVPSGVTHVRLSARVTLQALGVGMGVEIYITKNGDTNIATNRINMPFIMEAIGATENHYHLWSGPLAVTPGDYFELVVLSSGDNSVTVQGTTDGCWFAIEEIENFSGAMVKKAADQTAANYSAGSIVTWDTEVLDVGGWHDTGSNTSRLTVPSGVSTVRVTAGIAVTSLLANAEAYVLMIKNGDTNAATRAINLPVAEEDSSAVIAFMQLSSGPLAVSPGDYFEIWPLIPGDASITIEDYSWFAIEKLS
jgi:hypothetical protein